MSKLLVYFKFIPFYKRNRKTKRMYDILHLDENGFMRVDSDATVGSVLNFFARKFKIFKELLGVEGKMLFQAFDRIIFGFNGKEIDPNTSINQVKGYKKNVNPGNPNVSFNVEFSKKVKLVVVIYFLSEDLKTVYSVVIIYKAGETIKTVKNRAIKKIKKTYSDKFEDFTPSKVSFLLFDKNWNNITVGTSTDTKIFLFGKKQNESNRMPGIGLDNRAFLVLKSHYNELSDGKALQNIKEVEETVKKSKNDIEKLLKEAEKNSDQTLVSGMSSKIDEPKDKSESDLNKDKIITTEGGLDKEPKSDTSKDDKITTESELDKKPKSDTSKDDKTITENELDKEPKSNTSKDDKTTSENELDKKPKSDTSKDDKTTTKSELDKKPESDTSKDDKIDKEQKAVYEKLKSTITQEQIVDNQEYNKFRLAEDFYDQKTGKIKEELKSMFDEKDTAIEMVDEIQLGPTDSIESMQLVVDKMPENDIHSKFLKIHAGKAVIISLKGMDFIPISRILEFFPKKTYYNIVQTASQYNGLESVNQDHSKIQSMANDKTQGPGACSLSLIGCLRREIAYERGQLPDSIIHILQKLDGVLGNYNKKEKIFIIFPKFMYNYEKSKIHLHKKPNILYENGYLRTHLLNIIGMAMFTKQLIYNNPKYLSQDITTDFMANKNNEGVSIKQVFSSAISYQDSQQDESGPSYVLNLLNLYPQYLNLLRQACNSTKKNLVTAVHVSAVGAGAFQNPPLVQHICFALVYSEIKEKVSGKSLLFLLHSFKSNNRIMKTLDNVRYSIINGLEELDDPESECFLSLLDEFGKNKMQELKTKLKKLKSSDFQIFDKSQNQVEYSQNGKIDSFKFKGKETKG